MKQLLNRLNKNLFKDLFLILLVFTQTLVGFSLVYITGHVGLVWDNQFDNLIRLCLLAFIALEFLQIFRIHFGDTYKKLWQQVVIYGSAILLTLAIDFYSYYRAPVGLNLATVATVFLTVYTVPLWLISRQVKQLTHWRYTFGYVWELLISYLLAFLLYLGLSFALATINFLFDNVLPGEVFMYASVFCFVLVARVLFLARRPKIKQLEESTDWTYPKILLLVNKYLLIPLVVLNLLILGVYFLARLLNLNETLELTLPAFVIGLFSPGLIGLATQLPKQEESRYFRIFGKVLSVALIIYLVPYFIAVLQNYFELGITVYLGHWLIFGIVFAVIGITYQLRPKSFLPVTLLVLGVLPFASIMIPFANTYNMSAGSQTNKLLQVLEASGRLSGTTINTEQQLAGTEYEIAGSAYDQLAAVHGFARLANQVDLDIELTKYGFISDGASSDRYELREYILGSYYSSDYTDVGQLKSIYRNYDDTGLVLDLTGFSAVRIISLDRDDAKMTYTQGNKTYNIAVSGSVLSIIESGSDEVLAIFDLSEVAEKSNYVMTFEEANLENLLIGSEFKSKLILRSISLSEKEVGSDSYEMVAVQAYLFTN